MFVKISKYLFTSSCGLNYTLFLFRFWPIITNITINLFQYRSKADDIDLIDLGLSAWQISVQLHQYIVNEIVIFSNVMDILILCLSLVHAKISTRV